MPNQTAQLDHVFKALADPTRRSIVERLGGGPASVGTLAAPYDMALPSLMQHLDVLERAGLVTSHKTGRIRTYRFVPQPLHAAETWLDAQRTLWEGRLDRLDRFLTDTSEPSAPGEQEQA